MTTETTYKSKFRDVKAELNLVKYSLQQANVRVGNLTHKSRLLNNHLRQMRDKIDYLLKYSSGRPTKNKRVKKK